MKPRIEYKYFVPPQLKSSLIQDIQKFTILDQYSNNSSGNYRVVSLYFESRDLKSYFDKIEGQARKFKVRLRYYPDVGETGNANLEIKYKLYDKCLKDKIRVGHFDLGALRKSSILELPDAWKEPVFDNFINLKKRFDLIPFVRVDYLRQAFHAFSDEKVRVTFDSRVKCSRLIGNINAKAYIPVIHGGYGVLEVKSPGYFPWWLSRIIKKYSLTREAISKYGFAVQNLATNSSLNLM